MNFKLFFSFTIFFNLNSLPAQFFIKNLTGKSQKLIFIHKPGRKALYFGVSFFEGEELPFIMRYNFIISNNGRLLFKNFDKTFKKKFGEDKNFQDYKLILFIKENSNHEIFLEPVIERIEEDNHDSDNQNPSNDEKAN